jgi:hypothetical protein
MDKDFSIVFEKLQEASANDEAFAVQTNSTELDEITELRKMVLEITEPEPMSYTTT